MPRETEIAFLYALFLFLVPGCAKEGEHLEVVGVNMSEQSNAGTEGGSRKSEKQALSFSWNSDKSDITSNDKEMGHGSSNPHDSRFKESPFLNGLDVFPFHTNLLKAMLGTLQIGLCFFLYFDHLNNKQKHRPMHSHSSILFLRPFTWLTQHTYTFDSITSTLVSLPSICIGSGISLATLPPSPIFLSILPFFGVLSLCTW